MVSFEDNEEIRLVRMKGLCWKVIRDKLRKVSLDVRFRNKLKLIFF